MPELVPEVLFSVIVDLFLTCLGPISGPCSERYCLKRRVRPPVDTHDGNENALGAVLVKRQLELALCVICMYSYSYS